MFKLMTERESVEVSLLERRSAVLSLLFAILILIITKILTTSNPALILSHLLLRNAFHLFSTFVSLLRVDKDFHAIVVKRFGFDHIQHIELDLVVASCIANSEVEPLSVAF